MKWLIEESKFHHDFTNRDYLLSVSEGFLTKNSPDKKMKIRK